jgi:hypothetical protein
MFTNYLNLIKIVTAVFKKIAVLSSVDPFERILIVHIRMIRYTNKICPPVQRVTSVHSFVHTGLYMLYISLFLFRDVENT